MQRERSERKRPGPEGEEPRRRPPTPAAALLALQATAGNRAATAHLQRYYAHPTWQRADGAPRNAKGKNVPKAGWTENDAPPQGAYLLQEKGRWYQWSQNARNWKEAAAPGGTETTEAEVELEGTADGTTAETKDTPPPELPKPKGKPPPADAGAFKPEQLEAKTTLKLGGNLLPQVLVDKVFEHLDSSAMIAMRGIDPFFRQYGSTALRQYLQKDDRLSKKLTAMSALDPDTELVQQYHDAIAERGPDQLVVATDQVNANTVEKIVQGFGGAVQIYHGEHKGQGGPDTDTTTYTPVKGPYDDPSDTKMHNKALVGLDEDERGQFLISGSPNLTKGGMEDNTESAAVVSYPGIATMYKEYIEHIAARSSDDKTFSEALKGFNETNPVGIRAALAPFVDIGETLNAELKGADEVTVRMFLVGSVKDNDPVDTLCALAKNGAKVSVIVDRSQAASTSYVRRALEKLQASGVRVATEKGQGGGIMHDKLIFAHHKATDKDPERYTVMIGSSGLTKHVISNWNYENLLIIDDKKLFEALQVHHTSAQPFRAPGIPAVDPTSELGLGVRFVEWFIGKPTDWRWKGIGQTIGVGKTYDVPAKAIFQAVEELKLIKFTDKWGKDWWGYP